MQIIEFSSGGQKRKENIAHVVLNKEGGLQLVQVRESVCGNW